MPNKTFYLPDDETALWDEAQKIIKRRRQSMSGLVTTLLKQWVEDNTSGLAKEMGLPTGFRPPSHLRDPREMKLDELADDMRARFREMLAESMRESSS